MNCVELSETPRDLVRRHLIDAANGWSVGTWGAIGEFQYDEDEPDLVVDADGLAVSSRRGALRIGDLSGVTPFALIDDNGRTREIAFCSARLANGRTVIHALDEVTFDLGIGVPHIDMLVRLSPDDLETRRALGAGLGRSLLTVDNTAGPAIGKASPTRIFRSAFAALEVHQPIPPPDGRSPVGPHSHLLPNHLKERRVHAPCSPLPAGLYCGLSLYPRTRL